MKDRYSHINLSGRRFETVIDGDDKHAWKLLNPAEQPEFDRLWSLMADELDLRWHIRQATRARLDAQSDPSRRRDLMRHLLSAVRLRRVLRQAERITA